jgi:hypothetical protein
MWRGLCGLILFVEIAYPCSCAFREPLCKVLARPGAQLRNDPAAPVFVGKVLYSYPSSWEEFAKLQGEFAATHPDLRGSNGDLLSFEGTRRFFLEMWGDKASATLRQNILAVQEEKRPHYVGPLSLFKALSHVEVIEPFGGIEKGTVVEILGGLGGGDCSVRFRAGGEYLVFLGKDAHGFWTTSICLGSTHVRYAQAELRALRAVRDGKPLAPFLSGKVSDATSRGARVEWKDLPGFPLRVTGEGLTREVVTGKDGEFFVDDLPLGSYTVSLATPGWELSRSVGQVPISLANGCQHVLLDVTQTQSSVTGRIQPTPGHTLTKLPVQLVPVTAGEAVRPPSGVMDTDGSFQINKVEPGEYYVVINPLGVPRPTGPNRYMPALPYQANYYPGKASKVEATSIRVERGMDVLLPGVWILPPPLAERRVQLLVRKATGEPFPGARVIVRDTEGDSVVNRAGPTPATGIVQFNVIEGRRYRIEAGAMDTNRRPGFYSAMELKPEDRGPLVLTLSEGAAPPNSYVYLFVSPVWTSVLGIR